MFETMGPRCRVALQALIESEEETFPGAIGRKGAILVRHGLARRLGLHTYNAGKIGVELPDRYVAFELTPRGNAACKELGLKG